MQCFHYFVKLWNVSDIEDTQCGFKLFSRVAAQKIFPNLRINRWIFDIELLVLARYLNIPTSEVLVNWTEKSGSKLSLVADSVNMVIDLIFMRIAYATGFWKISSM